MVVLFGSLLLWDDDPPEALFLVAAGAAFLGHGSALLLDARAQTGLRRAALRAGGALYVVGYLAMVAVLLLR